MQHRTGAVHAAHKKHSVWCTAVRGACTVDTWTRRASNAVSVNPPLDRNLTKANCTGNRVCTSCDIVVLGSRKCFISLMDFLRNSDVEGLLLIEWLLLIVPKQWNEGMLCFLSFAHYKEQIINNYLPFINNIICNGNFFLLFSSYWAVTKFVVWPHGMASYLSCEQILTLFCCMTFIHLWLRLC